MTRDEIVRSLSERWRFSIAEDSAIWNDVGAALQERDAQTLDKVLGVLAHARAHYSEEIFEADGVSLECCQARWARNLLGGIMDDIRALLEGAGKK